MTREFTIRPRAKKKTRTISIRIGVDIYKALVVKADESDTTVNHAVAQVLENYVTNCGFLDGKKGI